MSFLRETHDLGYEALELVAKKVRSFLRTTKLSMAIDTIAEHVSFYTLMLFINTISNSKRVYTSTERSRIIRHRHQVALEKRSAARR